MFTDRSLPALLIAALAACPLLAQTHPRLAGDIRADMPELLRIYKHLHANPELSYQEAETARFVAADLRGLGFDVTENVGGYGVVGVLRNGTGPTLMIRTDLDALPVVEQTGLPFASTVTATEQNGQEVGVMHACGHDVHMTALLGTARRLAHARLEWRGTLMMIGQPAEERGGGAKAMLADGLFERFPRPDFNLAMHVSAALPAGRIAATPGFALASVDSVDITVHGIGGHGAYPHTTRDPVVLASQIVIALQTIVSRETSPLEPAVVTVGSFNAGAKHNVISDRADLQLTVRTYNDEVRRRILESIERIAINLGRAAGLPEDRLPEVRVLDESLPSTYNDPELARRAADAISSQLGEGALIEAAPVMGAEDFSLYGRVEPRIPSLMLWAGAVEPGRWRAARESGEILPSLHSPFFAPDYDSVIPTGVEAMTAAALELLKR
ncbi:MAG: amidohydrolase [Planctomycetota bacterium]